MYIIIVLEKGLEFVRVVLDASVLVCVSGFHDSLQKIKNISNLQCEHFESHGKIFIKYWISWEMKIHVRARSSFVLRFLGRISKKFYRCPFQDITPSLLPTNGTSNILNQDRPAPACYVQQKRHTHFRSLRLTTLGEIHLDASRTNPPPPSLGMLGNFKPCVGISILDTNW